MVVKIQMFIILPKKVLDRVLIDVRGGSFLLFSAYLLYSLSSATTGAKSYS